MGLGKGVSPCRRHPAPERVGAREGLRVSTVLGAIVDVASVIFQWQCDEAPPGAVVPARKAAGSTGGERVNSSSWPFSSRRKLPVLACLQGQAVGAKNWKFRPVARSASVASTGGG